MKKESGLLKVRHLGTYYLICAFKIKIWSFDNTATDLFMLFISNIGILTSGISSLLLNNIDSPSQLLLNTSQSSLNGTRNSADFILG